MSRPVTPLAASEADALRAHLEKDIPGNLYLLGLLEEHGGLASAESAGFQVYGKYSGSELSSALFVGGGGSLMIPSTGDALDLSRIATALEGKVSMRSCIGDVESVDVLLRFFGSHTGVRYEATQRLYQVSADDLGPFTNPTLRLARSGDWDGVVELAAAQVEEVHGRKPLEEDADGFRARVLRRIIEKRTYVLEQADGAIIFKIDVGARSHHGAELEGLFTAPDVRKSGHATLTLGQISRHLLSSIPRLTLRTDENASLARIARKVGFVPGRAVKTVISRAVVKKASVG